jgi:hypothetical protein
MEFRQPADFVGLWTRSWLSLPDGTEDRSTAVAWLQGSGRFVDLRQPSDAPVAAHALRSLDRAGVAVLARQQGFAGVFVKDDDVYEWRREIDLQPTGPHPDRGRMRGDASLMIETGVDAAYVEHWHRAGHERQPLLSLEMRDGVRVVLVRVGPWFMLARDRSVAVPHGDSLSAIVAGTSDLADAQDLVDLEISLGRVEGDDWRIERSTLPWRCGSALSPQIGRDEMSYDDRAADGAPFRRSGAFEDSIVPSGELL